MEAQVRPPAVLCSMLAPGDLEIGWVTRMEALLNSPDQAPYLRIPGGPCRTAVPKAKTHHRSPTSNSFGVPIGAALISQIGMMTCYILFRRTIHHTRRLT